MAIIASIDISTRSIYLDTGVAEIDDLLAFWREYRDFRIANTDNSRLSLPIMSVIGGQSKGGGKLVGRIIDLAGYKIIPDDAPHSLLVTIEIIDSVGGLSGRDVFDRSGLVNDVNIDINIAPVEIVERGTSGLTSEESAALLQNTTDLSTIAGEVTTTDDNIAGIQSDISDIKTDIINLQADTAFMVAIESGEWKIVSNQMIFYDTGGTEIARFDLEGQTGDPAMTDVFRRIPV